MGTRTRPAKPRNRTSHKPTSSRARAMRLHPAASSSVLEHSALYVAGDKRQESIAPGNLPEREVFRLSDRLTLLVFTFLVAVIVLALRLGK